MPKMFASAATREATGGARGSPGPRPQDPAPKETAGGSQGKERVEKLESGKGARPAVVRDLYCTRACSKDEPFQALSVGGMAEGEGSDPLVAQWSGLALGDRVWMDDTASATYARGSLIPDIAKQMYGSPSEVLIEKAAKSLV